MYMAEAAQPWSEQHSEHATAPGRTTGRHEAFLARARQQRATQPVAVPHAVRVAQQVGAQAVAGQEVAELRAAHAACAQAEATSRGSEERPAPSARSKEITHVCGPYPRARRPDLPRRHTARGKRALPGQLRGNPTVKKGASTHPPYEQIWTSSWNALCCRHASRFWTSGDSCAWGLAASAALNASIVHVGLVSVGRAVGRGRWLPGTVRHGFVAASKVWGIAPCLVPVWRVVAEEEEVLIDLTTSRPFPPCFALGFPGCVRRPGQTCRSPGGHVGPLLMWSVARLPEAEHQPDKRRKQGVPRAAESANLPSPPHSTRAHQ